MGEISRKLTVLIHNGLRNLPLDEGQRKRALESAAPPKDVKDVQQLVEEGYDPVHAAYIAAQNFVAFFMERFSEFEELALFTELYCDAEEEYMPSGPPLSPLTLSYFSTWASFDLRFGKDLETIGTCLLDVAEPLGIDPGMIRIIQLFQQSRMGIYEHLGIREARVQLRELVTGDEFSCYSPAGYQGEKGELWHVRLCPPPLAHDLANYHVAFTTPHILGECTKADWIAYLRKSTETENPDRRDALHSFMKYGREPNFWNEYVFLAYHHYQKDAIFLAGLPDVKESLPQAELAKKR